MDDEYYDYRTSDLSLAATLVCLGYYLTGLERGNDYKVLFEFSLNKSGKDAIDSYWNDGLTVNPRLYFDNLKMLKNRLYSE
jgi:hypothetical protein